MATFVFIYRCAGCRIYRDDVALINISKSSGNLYFHCMWVDPSGSRRFICIEVTAPIQTNVTINYKQLYAQAMEAIYKGERYWLNDEDESILKQTNREFEQASPLEQLFHCYLNPVEEEMEGEWLTAMQILSYLQTKTRDKLAISKVGQFGRVLQKLNIPCRKSRKGTLYHLVKVE